MEIVALGPGDEDRVSAAAHLFDGPAQPGATRHFLRRQGHHLLVAYVDGSAVGFVSGIEVEHPDKGCEMLLYELGVDEEHRRRGVGRALVDRLGTLAQELSCYGMWVVTDALNEAARALYEGAGAVPEIDQVVEVWTFTSPVETENRHAGHPASTRSSFSPQKQANGLSLNGGTSA